MIEKLYQPKLEEIRDSDIERKLSYHGNRKISENHKIRKQNRWSVKHHRRKT